MIATSRVDRVGGTAVLGGAVELVEFLLAGLDDQDVTVALPVGAVRGVAGVIAAPLGVAVRRDRHLQRNGIAVRSAVAVRIAARHRSFNRLARRRRVGEEERNRKINLQTAAAPAARLVERGDDGVGAGVFRETRQVLRPGLRLREEAPHLARGPAAARRAGRAGPARPAAARGAAEGARSTARRKDSRRSRYDVQRPPPITAISADPARSLTDQAVALFLSRRGRREGPPLQRTILAAFEIGGSSEERRPEDSAWRAERSIG